MRASLARALLLAAAAAATAPPAPPTPFQVTYDTYALGGGAFTCNGDDNVDIFYPSDLSSGPFPVLAFGHGAGGTVKGMAPLIDLVAGMGMIVLGPAQSGKLAAPAPEDCTEWKDMLRVLDGSKASPQLHPALQHADFTRTGLFGHSMGAESTPLAAAAALQKGGYGLRAMLSSHSWFKGQASLDAVKNVTVPAMFTACADDKASQNGKPAFDSCPGRPKIWANLPGGGHMEPIQGGRNNAFDAHFLACHVADYQPSCDKVYTNSSASMCKQQEYVDCDIVTA